MRPLSLIVGTRPLGFIARYSGSRLPTKGPPRSTRSYSMPSSAQHHSTFCTLDEVVRPQIFSIAASPITVGRMEPQFPARRNSGLGEIIISLHDREAASIARSQQGGGGCTGSLTRWPLFCLLIRGPP